MLQTLQSFECIALELSFIGQDVIVAGCFTSRL